MSVLLNTLLRGFVTIIPLLITGSILYWFFTSLEEITKGVLLFLLPAEIYFPGLGFLTALSLIFLIGVLMKASLLRKIFEYFENRLLLIPIIKSIYGVCKDFFEFFNGQKANEFSKVVLCPVPESDKKTLGFVTSQNPGKDVSSLGNDLVAVYLPMSYQLGGFTVFIHKDELEEVDISVSKAMQYVLTAGVVKTK